MRNSLILTTALCFLALAALPAQAADLKAGAAVRLLTPDPLLPVSGGVGTPNPTTSKLGDLFARTAVFEKGDTRLALVGVDFLGWNQVLGAKVSAQVKGIPAENILIGATHTHSAPDTYGFPDQQGNHGADLAYLDWVCDQIAAAINDAVSKLQPADLKIAVGDAKGKIAYNYYAEQLYDPRCGVIQAIAKSGKPIVTFVNYASHPEVIGSGQGILSPDYCGPLYDKIEAETGGIAVFMNGALGGMVTADCRGEDDDIQTWDECVRIGELLAGEALRIVRDAPLQSNPTLYCAAKTIQFPIDSPLLQAVLKRSPLDYEVRQDNTITTRLNLINIGTAQMLTIPGEALPNIGYYVKRNNYISRTCLGERTGEIYMDQALALVKDSPAPDKR